MLLINYDYININHLIKYLHEQIENNKIKIETIKGKDEYKDLKNDYIKSENDIILFRSKLSILEEEYKELVIKKKENDNLFINIAELNKSLTNIKSQIENYKKKLDDIILCINDINIKKQNNLLSNILCEVYDIELDDLNEENIKICQEIEKLTNTQNTISKSIIEAKIKNEEISKINQELEYKIGEYKHARHILNNKIDKLFKSLDVKNTKLLTFNDINIINSEITNYKNYIDYIKRCYDFLMKIYSKSKSKPDSDDELNVNKFYNDLFIVIYNEYIKKYSYLEYNKDISPIENIFNDNYLKNNYDDQIRIFIGYVHMILFFIKINENDSIMNYLHCINLVKYDINTYPIKIFNYFSLDTHYDDKYMLVSIYDELDEKIQDEYDYDRITYINDNWFIIVYSPYNMNSNFNLNSGKISYNKANYSSNDGPDDHEIKYISDNEKYRKIPKFNFKDKITECSISSIYEL